MDNQEKPSFSDSLKDEKISLSSRKKWFWLGVVVALISPISGVILSIAFWTEPDLKKEGRIIFILSLVWGIVFLYLSNWLVRQGYLPV
jgi:membrane-associated HD superfamily phosphohydrolase